MIDWTFPVTVDAGLAFTSRPDGGSRGSLHRVDGVIDRVHRTAGPFNRLGRHRPLDRPAGMHRTADAPRDEQPGKEPHLDP